MDNFSIQRACVILFFTVLQTRFWTKRAEDTYEKTIYVFTTLSVCIYSGLGIAYQDVPVYYILMYIFFITLLNGVIYFIFHVQIRDSLYIVSGEKNINRDYDVIIDNRLVLFMVFVFYASLFAYLLYPTFRVNELWNPPSPTTELIYSKRSAASSTAILSLCDTLNVFSRPFLLLYLYQQLKDGKKVKFTVMVLFWVYLIYLQYGYIGRYQMVIYGLFIFFALFFLKDGELVFSKKHVISLCIIGIVSIPFLLAYQYIRIGGTFTSASISDTFFELIESEINYPRYYASIETFAGDYSILTFVLWIVCLAIPSAIFPWKPVSRVSYFFTEKITGLVYGAQEYYSSILPSVMGEGMIVWGMSFFWIHAVVIGLVIGVYLRSLHKYKSLTLVALYQMLFLLTLGRGGATSLMGNFINGSIVILALYYISEKVYTPDYNN